MIASAAATATRKRIVRAVLHEIVVRLEGGHVVLVLHWHRATLWCEPRGESGSRSDSILEAIRGAVASDRWCML